MKKIILATLFLLSAVSLSQAQKIRLNLYGSYVFEDRFDSYYDAYNYYEGKFNDGAQYGGGFEFMAKPEYGVELLYLRQETTAPTTYLSGKNNSIQYSNFDVNINYIFLAPVRHIIKPDGKVDGFGGIMLGMAVLDITEPVTKRSENVTKFAWGLKGGANIWLSDKVALKLMAQLTSITQAAGGGLYFGTGGASAGLSTYSTVFQFGLGGGLVFAFGK